MSRYKPIYQCFQADASVFSRILLQGPLAQQLKQMKGKEAGVAYAMEVLTKAQKSVEKAYQSSRNRDREMEQ